MKTNIEVEIEFDGCEHEWCAECCKFLQDAASTDDMGDDYCWLFGESLKLQNGFPLRCKPCLSIKEIA